MVDKIKNVIMAGPSHCQDGITNNCTQNCTRKNGTYECSCYPGFVINSTAPEECEGKQFYIILMKPLELLCKF